MDDPVVDDPVVDDPVVIETADTVVVDDVMPPPRRPAVMRPNPAREPDPEPVPERRRRRIRVRHPGSLRRLARRRPQEPREPRRPRQPRAPRRRRPGARTLVVALAVLAVAGLGTAAVRVLGGHELPFIGGGSDSGAAEQQATTPETPEAPQTPATRSPIAPELARAAADLRRMVGEKVDVVDLSLTADLLVIGVSGSDPSDTGRIFSIVHESGLEPQATVLQHYDTVVNPVTGQSELDVVSVYRMSRSESERQNWIEPLEIRWDTFLTYPYDR